MASVIERHGHSIDDQGHIHYDDRPSTYEAAEKLVGRRLDRRRNYAIIDGQVCDAARWSRACSGCYQGREIESGVGLGCSECDECTDYDDDCECERCHGDGMDPWNDYLLPCPLCQGEQQPVIQSPSNEENK